MRLVSNKINPLNSNTIAAESKMSYIDGEKRVLEYVGIDIDALARNSSFEEVIYLLWHRKLPKAAELERKSGAVQSRKGFLTGETSSSITAWKPY